MTIITLYILVVGNTALVLSVFYRKVNPANRKEGAKDWIDNPRLIQAIPGYFSMSGIIGTFIGILIALNSFNTEDIGGSIPKMLEGLTLAFITSVIGLVLHVIFSLWGKHLLHKYEDQFFPEKSDEFKKLVEVEEAINNFSKDFASSTSESLVNELKGVSETTNSIFKELLETLVDENFGELKESINQLSEWQREHKKELSELHRHIQALIQEFSEIPHTIESYVSSLNQESKSIIKNLIVTTESINDAAENIENLSSKQGLVHQTFRELESLTQKDGTFQKAMQNAKGSVQELAQSWVNRSKEYENNLGVLISETQKFGSSANSLAAGFQSVSEKAEELRGALDRISEIRETDLKGIESQFYRQLSGTLGGLDQLLEEHVKNMKNITDRINFSDQ